MTKISKNFTRMKKDHVIAMDYSDKRIEQKGCLGFNEAYLNQVSAEQRSSAQTATLTSVIENLFDTAYGTLGRDILGTTYDKLSAEQKDWLSARLEEFQNDLLNLHRRIAFIALKHNGILEGIPDNIDSVPSVERESFYRIAIENLQKNPKAKMIFDELEASCKTTCAQLTEKFIPAPLVSVRYNQASVPAEQKENFSVVSSSNFNFNFGSSSGNSNPFLWAAGWSDAGSNHANNWLYFGSSDYRSGVVDRQLVECCGNICCGNSHGNCCNSCGEVNCHCPSITCPNCHCAECSCPNFDCCSSCGTECRCSSNDSDGIFKCCGITIMGGAGAGMTAAKAIAGDDTPSSNEADSSTGMHYDYLHASYPNQMGSTGVALDSSQALALSSTGTAAAASSHATFLTSTAAQVAATASFALLAVGHVARAIGSPLKNLVSGYKMERSAIQLVSGLAAGATTAAMTEKPHWAGPHTATVAGVGALIVAYQGSKELIRIYARKNNNGISNPEKWLLTSAVLQQFKDAGYPPRQIVALIQTLRELKENGKVKSNNKGYGAFKFLRGMAYLVDCCKDEQEVTPDKILLLLQKHDMKAFALLKKHFPFFAKSDESVVQTMEQEELNARRYAPPPSHSMEL